MNLLLTTLAPINYIGYVEYGNPTKSDYFVLLLLVRESIRLSVCPHTFDIYHRYLWYLASILRSYIQHDNKLKWTYAPQSCLHYRFKRETCYLSCVLPKRKKNFLKYWVPGRGNTGSSRDVLNSLFWFYHPVSLLTPTRSAVGSYPTRLCVFHHSLSNLSGRHGADGSALARFLLFGVWSVKQIRCSSFTF